MVGRMIKLMIGVVFVLLGIVLNIARLDDRINKLESKVRELTLNNQGQMRTPEQICARMQAAAETPFGFALEVLAGYVPFEAAKAAGLLKDGATGEGWDARTPSRDLLLADMAEYM